VTAFLAPAVIKRQALLSGANNSAPLKTNSGNAKKNPIKGRMIPPMKARARANGSINKPSVRAEIFSEKHSILFIMTSMESLVVVYLLSVIVSINKGKSSTTKLPGGPGLIIPLVKANRIKTKITA